MYNSMIDADHTTVVNVENESTTTTAELVMYPKEYHKLAIVWIAVVLAAASNWVTLAYIHDYVPRCVILSW